MAEGNGETTKLKSAITSKKLIAFCVGIVTLTVFAFTGKVSTGGVESALLTLLGSYFGTQGAIDIVKAVKTKTNGTGQP